MHNRYEHWTPGGPGGGRLFPRGPLGGDCLFWTAAGAAGEALCANCASRIPAKQITGGGELMEGPPASCDRCGMGLYPAYGPVTEEDLYETEGIILGDLEALRWRQERIRQVLDEGQDAWGRALTGAQVARLTARMARLEAWGEALRTELRALRRDKARE